MNVPFRSNQGDTCRKEFCGDAGHRHFLYHQGEFCAFQHDHVLHLRALSSFCYGVGWLAGIDIVKEIRNLSNLEFKI